ncbi:MAG: sigma-70 family RNA polymerase sigma factor [Dysgonomonas sp.]|nr:sigma-70 family RNA polymerase sigma factor [Dysgonomonas sp.]
MFIKNQNIFEDSSLLWDSFLKGSDNAYNHIYENFAKKLFVQGLQFTSDRELIMDCIHDVFINIYKNRTTLKPVNNLKIYLFISLRNSIVSALKKQNNQFEELDETSDQAYISDNSDIEEELIYRENASNTQQYISQLLLQLTTRQREAIHYRFYENMSIDEICILMDMKYQSVQNLIQRSLKKISDTVKKK